MYFRKDMSELTSQKEKYRESFENAKQTNKNLKQCLTEVNSPLT